MGVLRQDFVVAHIPDYAIEKNKERYDNLIEFMDKNNDLFSYKLNLTNGENCFMMCWDGSKEGWSESDRGDELRKKFIDFLKGFKYGGIYHVHDGDYYEEPILTEL